MPSPSQECFDDGSFADYGTVTSTDILINVLKELLINNDKLCLRLVDINILI